MGSDYAKILQRIRVPIRTVWVVFFLIFSRPTGGLVLAGLLISVAGLALRIWAAGCIEKSRELEVRGPYRFTRNPLYFGTFLIGLGGSVASGNPWILAGFAAVFVTVYLPVMKREEEEMTKLFPEDFRAYQSRVSMFWPGMGGKSRNDAKTPSVSPAGSETRFSWSRVARNREYNSVLGFAAVFAWILFRLWLS